MSIPKALVKLVLERDGHLCVLRLPGCMGEASVADHRANRGFGGSKVLNDAANLIAACGFCNEQKEHADAEERAELIALGHRVEADSTHAKTLLRCRIVPVKYPGGTRYRLTSDGLRNRVLPGEGAAY